MIIPILILFNVPILPSYSIDFVFLCILCILPHLCIQWKCLFFPLRYDDSISMSPSCVITPWAADGDDSIRLRRLMTPPLPPSLHHQLGLFCAPYNEKNTMPPNRQGAMVCSPSFITKLVKFNGRGDALNCICRTAFLLYGQIPT